MVDARAEPDWERLEALFHAALDVSAAEREAFLARECAGDAALRAELDGLLSADDDAETFLGDEDRASAAAPLVAEQLPRRLGPWQLEAVVGEGGMGVVYEATRADGAYEQRVAVKMLRPGPATTGLLERFAAERRTLARLEHPGIARLLDAGQDGGGAPWLAMEYVRGAAIDTWCDAGRLDVRARVELVREVARAVAHAHDQLVVHRDLKPENVLVDVEGRPRLLDFGIAKVLGSDDDLTLTETSQRALTPAYAAPEQLRGEAVGVRADVFALGVVLYEVLSGVRPHGRTTTSRGELEREILEADARPPSAASATHDDPAALARARGTDPRALRRQLAGDLDRIVLTCLRKEPERRYDSAAALADDLGRWLAGLPVRARGDGLLYRAGKLVRRRPVETALAGLLAVVGVAGAATFVDASLRDRDRLDEIQRLGDLSTLAGLRAEAESLWPIHPDVAPRIEAWLATARGVLARRELHAETLERWRLEAEAADDEVEGTDWREWCAARLAELQGELATLEATDRYGPTIAGLEHRLDRARGLARRSIDDERAAWDAALARMAADPRYAELFLEPQLGLVPLGPDRDGGLEAFWHVETGARPERDADGRFLPTAEGGLVLLLVPEAETLVGGQLTDPNAPYFDPLLESDEGPSQAATLGAYLISKFEVTQAQWERWTGQNPSDYLAPSTVGGRSFGPTNPVERVSWEQARAVLARFELDLPTEAQWEHAARAGTDTVWPTGDDERSLAGFANFADAYAARNGGSAGWVTSDWVDDGHTVHAPVGSYAPNAFGLHDTLGNLWEWCRDRYLTFAESTPRRGDGLRGADREFAPDHDIAARGGGYGNPPSYLRSAYRYAASPTLESRSTGVRPARGWR